MSTILVPVEVSEQALARVTGQGKSKTRGRPILAEEHKPDWPEFERVASYFGYTVRRKSEAA